MFWRRKGKKQEEGEATPKKMALPPLDQLEQWVLTLIIKLELKPGTFTFLPAYGGVLLFVQNEGLAWFPYKEIKEAMGRLDNAQLLESSAYIGGIAGVASGVLALPVLLIPKVLKGSYQVIARPSPKRSISFLRSTIDEVIIKEEKLKQGLLKTFEGSGYKGKETDLPAHVILIRRKFIDKPYSENFFTKIMKGMSNFFSTNKDLIFSIPPQSHIKEFAKILEEEGIKIKWIVNGSSDDDPALTDDETSENQ